MVKELKKSVLKILVEKFINSNLKPRTNIPENINIKKEKVK